MHTWSAVLVRVSMEMWPQAESMSELIIALEKATLMAKQLPNTTNPSQIHQICSSLHSAHQKLTMFLLTQSTPFPQPSLISPAVDCGGDETMQVADEEAETEQSSKSPDGVQDKLKDWCFVQNKRPKRMLSPCSADQLENEAMDGFDPHQKKLRALDLIYQFHS